MQACNLKGQQSRQQLKEKRCSVAARAASTQEDCSTSNQAQSIGTIIGGAGLVTGSTGKNFKCIATGSLLCGLHSLETAQPASLRSLYCSWCRDTCAPRGHSLNRVCTSYYTSAGVLGGPAARGTAARRGERPRSAPLLTQLR